MKSHLTRAAAAVGTAALIASSLLATASAAQADPGDGTLVVNIVDQYGRPTSGFLEAIAPDGTVFTSAGAGGPLGAAGSTQTLTIPANGYALTAITPWSGISCFGLASCSLTGGGGGGAPVVTTPVVTVPAGGAATYTTRVTVPSITGSSAIGSPLMLQVPQGLTDFMTVLALSGLPGSVTQQWVRGATDVPGATGSSYTTVSSDASQPVSARLAPPLGMTVLFSALGMTVPPFSTNAITMAKAVKVKTKVKTRLPKSIAANETVSAKVKVTAKHAVPEGSVTLTIGKFKVRKSLKHGSVFITLPRLKAGTYKVSVSYGGAEQFAKSKSKKFTLTVHN